MKYLKRVLALGALLGITSTIGSIINGNFSIPSYQIAVGSIGFLVVVNVGEAIIRRDEQRR